MTAIANMCTTLRIWFGHLQTHLRGLPAALEFFMIPHWKFLLQSFFIIMFRILATKAMSMLRPHMQSFKLLASSLWICIVAAKCTDSSWVLKVYRVKVRLLPWKAPDSHSIDKLQGRNMLSLILVSILLSQASAIQTNDCPVGWESLYGKCYLIATGKPTTWNLAQQHRSRRTMFFH